MLLVVPEKTGGKPQKLPSTFLLCLLQVKLTTWSNSLNQHVFNLTHPLLSEVWTSKVTHNSSLHNFFFSLFTCKSELYFSCEFLSVPSHLFKPTGQAYAMPRLLPSDHTHLPRHTYQISYLTSMFLSVVKSQCSMLSTSATPHGYSCPRTFFWLDSTTVLLPTIAKGMASYARTRTGTLKVWS